MKAVQGNLVSGVPGNKYGGRWKAPQELTCCPLSRWQLIIPMDLNILGKHLSCDRESYDSAKCPSRETNQELRNDLFWLKTGWSKRERSSSRGCIERKMKKDRTEG